MLINAPFANESESVRFAGLTIENRLDRVSFYGNIDITKDAQGLSIARELKTLMDGLVEQLEHEESQGRLLEKLAVRQVEEVDNPFSA